ncbi:MAG: hypothetical protein BWY13_00379 [Euryarchaeota archaeon ADurb.Bin190]|jgi:uncharacterized protein (DUF58 family)|nr:MAG: hypothetical protein BWY13_00379 [Euryarchaeota archaeon ADurb.Bin190]HNQ54110.1 DUF58 domain-containing protein [Methanothrix sp.]HNU39265.1 DUF58 domain-containing protein [Methanothrix sp.]HPA97529.1 DUF58 domain-containing protein [Methanothrix sp.]HPH48016.1 DUF58 domain-containing protein [Methanothrix sp.]
MDTEFFQELDRFSLLVKKRVSTAYSGGRKSLRFGHGISPVGYREYRKGDDFKLVDWKVFGRTEKLYIREHEEERSLVVHILLDGSASMDYEGKFSFASRLAAGFAYLAAADNEKYAISLFCKKLYPGEPKRGRMSLFQSIEDLDATKPHGGTSLKAVADQMDSLLKSTSLVVLISDLLGKTEDALYSIYRLAGHELVVIQVLARSEMELDYSGDIKFVDPEGSEPVITRITEAERSEYLKKLSQHNHQIQEACRQVGADYFLFASDRPVFDAFSEMLSRAVVWKA